ncbi:hypothetical protein CYQ88_03060 [Hydrogenovibrio sp. SC-1]|uniref:hypothetical protein n=1 Tax=Hydrogenovibrio sp. SC-1 TaxID=2065820 RepID=UPI000C7BF0DF|nr:hypothetical protein [Hydrogenovibrio sp. SC-1]PLA74898.1 hypothetical protein CYQ88_03060 [Hydrogenovibrio sp. SC-1]
MSSLHKLVVYTFITFLIAIGYYWTMQGYSHPDHPETFLNEVGEEIGEVALWLLVFIYARTLLKLMSAKGSFAQRLIPGSINDLSNSLIRTVLIPLNKTHAYVGIATLAVILLHIALVGWHLEILLFQVVLGLLIWQGLFGFFLRWRFSPRQLKQFSYLVHAQFVTGIMIGIFSYVGHWLVD